MNKQYELVRIITKSNISDEEIDEELSAITTEEWNKYCVLLDTKIKEDVEKLNVEAREEALLEVLKDMSMDNGFSATTLWISYLKWLDVEYV